MKTIPKYITISGNRIAVKYEDLDAEDLAGKYSGDTLTISINSTIPKRKHWTIFIHEVIEAMNGIYDIKLKHHQVNLLESAMVGAGITIKAGGDNAGKD